MALFGLFGSESKNIEVFEKELTLLSQKVSTTQQQIVRLKSKRTLIRTQLIIYLASFYILVLGYLYLQVPRDYIGGSSRVYNFLRFQSSKSMMILVSTPIGSYGFIYLIDLLLKYLISKRESLLETLKEKRGKKIDELKKITNYTRTHELLDKYGDEKPKELAKPPIKQPALPPAARPAPPTNPLINVPASPTNPSNTPTPNTPSSSNLSSPAPQSRTLQDRILDYIIGSENNESIENRFALICSKCYHHNGLAPPGSSNPQEIVYICPYCGLINGDASKREETIRPVQEIEEPITETGIDNEHEPSHNPVDLLKK
ncbi:hypothetical protein HYPBUDRAFT_102661 [Hyphopichia burtonii NRRL Y-1933]|uniref:Endoplasmic reticulum junction formation protein lunapark n=1 Tax=Hyphopichia burtonii NRRL Y-1933 TaxID=984485 RepID=A0A1E4RQL0_9ASCO|nr:hypothetical protein HYPBUDRAFT_102661 [Hyphopichia burtonii NRRL Y-1933]ODV69559.1 hypothetical protein HYPBUDRAFT_102661 [Hyphopichia burtonii NRRL Y-1933]